MYSTASVACKNWHPHTTSGTYLPQNTREASYAIFPIGGCSIYIGFCITSLTTGGHEVQPIFILSYMKGPSLDPNIDESMKVDDLIILP